MIKIIIGSKSLRQPTESAIAKGQFNPKMPTKNLKDLCPGSLLEGRAEILEILVDIFGETMTS